MASLLEEINSTLLDIRSYGEQRSGTVRIAASQQSYPDIKVILHDRVQQWVLQSVRNAEVDFGIFIGPLNDSDLDCQAILDEQFLLLCCHDDPLAFVDQAQWHMLAGRTMVLQDYASGSSVLIDVALRQQDIEINVVQEIGHPATLFPHGGCRHWHQYSA